MNWVPKRLEIAIACLGFCFALAACKREPCPVGETILMRSSNYYPIQAVSASGEGILKCSFPEFKGDDPDWSPDGKWIAYDTCMTKAPYDSQIYVIPPNGGTPRQVTTDEYGACKASWSPDGIRLAFEGDYGIYIANLQCLSNGRECPSDVNHFGSGWFPDWSPDGQYLLYGRYPQERGRSYDVLVAEIDHPDTVVDVTPPDTWGCYSAKWSPNGRAIVADCREEVTSDIFVIDWPALTSTNLTNSPEAFDVMPIWSPDGTRIAFASEDAEDLGKCLNAECTVGSRDVFIINADGTGFRRITYRKDKAVVWIAWMPDIPAGD